MCLTCSTLSPEHHTYVLALSSVVEQCKFRIWSGGRREDSDEENVTWRAMLGQPGQVRPWLLIGDLADAEDLAAGKLQHRRITSVMNLCPNHMTLEHRQEIRQSFTKRDISYIEIFEEDRHDYDIITNDLPTAIDFAREAKDSGGSLLVHCYGGVNRSAAIAVALLMMIEGVPLLSAAAEVVNSRGFVLSNQAFRRRLVVLAAKEDLLGVLECTWKTEDGTELLRLVQRALQSGHGEAHVDQKGYNLSEWEDWYDSSGVEDNAKWMRARADSVRCLLQSISKHEGM